MTKEEWDKLPVMSAERAKYASYEDYLRGESAPIEVGNGIAPLQESTTEVRNDSANYNLEYACLACEYLKSLSNDIDGTIASLAGIEPEKGVDANGKYAESLGCFYGTSDQPGMSDSFSAAYERAKNVRNGLLAQEGIAEDAFDEEGQRISNMLLGQTTQFYMQQEMSETLSQWDSMKKEDPDAYIAELEKAALNAQGKDPSEWTQDDIIALMIYDGELNNLIAIEGVKNDWDYETEEELAASWEYWDTLNAKKKELEDYLKVNGLMDYTDSEKGWMDLKEAWNTLVMQGTKTTEAFANRDGTGWGELGTLAKMFGATGAVIGTDIAYGADKLVEFAEDGMVLGMSGLGLIMTGINDVIFGTNESQKLLNEMFDMVNEDRAGSAYNEFYEGYSFMQAINDASVLKYDSAGNKLAQGGIIKLEEATLATILTVMTGGTTAALAGGFLVGTGREGERRAGITDAEGNYTNRELKDLFASYLSGIGNAGKWAALGNAGANLASGLMGTNAVTMTAPSKLFTGNNMADAFHNMTSNMDFWIDSISTAANAAITRIDTGEWDWKGALLDFGLNLAGNYFGEYLDATRINNDYISYIDELSGTGKTVMITDGVQLPDSFPKEKYIQEGQEYLNSIVPGTNMTGLEYLEANHCVDPSWFDDMPEGVTEFEIIGQHNAANGLHFCGDESMSTNTLYIGSRDSGYGMQAMNDGGWYFGYTIPDEQYAAYKTVFPNNKNLQFCWSGNCDAMEMATNMGLNVEVCGDAVGLYSGLERIVLGIG